MCMYAYVENMRNPHIFTIQGAQQKAPKDWDHHHQAYSGTSLLTWSLADCWWAYPRKLRVERLGFWIVNYQAIAPRCTKQLLVDSTCLWLFKKAPSGPSAPTTSYPWTLVAGCYFLTCFRGAFQVKIWVDAAKKQRIHTIQVMVQIHINDSLTALLVTSLFALIHLIACTGQDYLPIFP